jgi:hypothetical protein
MLVDRAGGVDWYFNGLLGLTDTVSGPAGGPETSPGLLPGAGSALRNP